ncbi:hypothetical protein ACTPEM_25950 [Clostridioides difficile]
MFIVENGFGAEDVLKSNNTVDDDYRFYNSIYRSF